MELTYNGLAIEGEIHLVNSAKRKFEGNDLNFAMYIALINLLTRIEVID